MAAPLRSVVIRFFSQNLSAVDCSILSTRSVLRNNLLGIRTAYSNVHTRRISGLYRVGTYVGAGVCLVGGVSVFSYFNSAPVLTSPLFAVISSTPDQKAKPTRMVWYDI